MISWLLVGSALAVDLDRYPLVAEVSLPESGAARVHLPPDLRSSADPSDGSDLMLVDAEGNAVPLVRLDQAEHWETPSAATEAVPTRVPLLWSVGLGPAPVDGVRVTLASAPSAATVVIEDLQRRALSEPTLLWRLADDAHETVPLSRPTRGTVRVRMTPHAEGLHEPPRVLGLRLTRPGVEPDRLRWAVSGVDVQPNGWVRYDVELDRALPVQAVRLLPSEQVVQRRVSVQAGTSDGIGGAVPWQLGPIDPTPVERLVLHGVHAEDMTVPLSGPPSDRLAVLVEMRSQPLQMTEVEVVLAGVHLLVLDAGPGPHRLYAGAPPNTSPAWDLNLATPELTRAALTVIEPEPAGPNSEWIPPETRGGLTAPGRELDVDGFSWSRAIQGSGLSRIPLPAAVLGEARSDLGDLRIEADGQQIPYLLRRRMAELERPSQDWTVRTWEGETVLEIPLDDPNVPIASVSLSTDAPIFERRLTVARRRGGDLQYLRAATWTGTTHPGTLDVRLGQRIGDTLIVTISDGDNPPLPITDVQLRTEAWEMVAVVPDQAQVRLLSGDHGRTAPRYDLSLVHGELGRRPMAVAVLGPRSEVRGPPRTWLDQLFVVGGLGALALGLLGLLADLLRRVPDEVQPAETGTA